MTSPAVTSAPGKVIVCGEYTVLTGAPALVLAVDRRVKVTASEIEPALAGISVFAPGYLPAEERLEWRNGILASANPALALLTRLLNALLSDIPQASARLRQSGWRLVVDSRPLFDQEHKLGLGSSAALGCALQGALRALATLPQALPDEAWGGIHSAHSLAQGKQGSGVDVAASLNGGASTFVNRGQAHCEIRSIHLPSSLPLAFIWTGASASTQHYLNSLSQWRAHNSDAFNRHMSVLAACSAQAIAGANDVTSLIQALKAFTDALHTFDRDSQLGIFAQGHDALYQLTVEQPDLIYKPCGAGGGDLGLAIAGSQRRLDDFITHVRARGMNTIDLRIDPVGLTLE